MPRRLIRAFHDIYAALSPPSVVGVLDRSVRPTLKLLGVWPSHVVDDMPSMPAAVLYGPDVSRALQEAHQQGIKDHGPSAMALAALANPPPFTFSEFARREQPRGTDRWIFDLLKEHGIADGLYCAYGSWLVVYWSPVVLRGGAALIDDARRVPTVLGGIAVGRLKELMKSHRKRGAKLAFAEFPELAAGERAVLRHLSQGQEAVDIATAMGLSENTVRTHVRRAMLKLHAKNQLHAVAIAVRNRLI